MKRFTSQAESSTFHPFLKLPPEIRNMIWEYAINNTEVVQPGLHFLYAYQEGCFDGFWENSTGDRWNRPDALDDYMLVLEFQHDRIDPARFSVPIASVSREACSIAVAWAQSQGPLIYTRVLFDGQVVFLRAIERDQDTIYVPPSLGAEFFDAPFKELSDPSMYGEAVDYRTNIHRIAMEESLVRTKATELSRMFVHLSDIDTLYIIVASPPLPIPQALKNAKSDNQLYQIRNRRQLASWEFDHWRFIFEDEINDISSELQDLSKLAAESMESAFREIWGFRFRIFSVSAIET
ncbi:hypothetical protein F5Y16DRAFT_286117 [Xylariaceae sp. FL0255]|nr:hypothetical protein F5Y16DRAFT_286117 [Xylariaceae sp. FL0255]